MPAASEAVGAPGGGVGGGGDVEQEYEIRNDEGFVYKVARGVHLDSAPSSSTQLAAGRDPKAVGLRRRRRALLRLRDKRLRDLARWEALASELIAPLPAPQPPAPSLPSSSQPDAAAAAAAAASSSSILDDLLAQVDTQAEFLKKARQWCDEVNTLYDDPEPAIFDSCVPPLWGANPKELMEGLCRPEEKTAYSMWCGNPKELIEGLCSPGEKTAYGKNGRQEASRESKMKKVSIKKQKMARDLPPILTESRKKKRVINLSCSNNVAPQGSVEPKRKKAYRSKSTAPGTPGSATRRKAESTPGSATRRKVESTPARAPDIVCSPGPLTRRRAAAKNESPAGS